MNEKTLQPLIDRLANKELIQTEEATKTAFVLPFLQSLGYDIFNPVEVIPEYIADIGKKKGEKVDYCIKQDGEPIIIIECKHWKENLDLHKTQLERYFHVTKAKFAILTNGIYYKFFTDIEAPNILDKKPFFEFNLNKIKDSDLNEISKFQKSKFDVDYILENAKDLKYLKGLKKLIESDIKEPSPEYIKFYVSQVYSKKVTSKILVQFAPIIKQAIGDILNERVNSRLKIAADKETEVQQALLEEAIELDNGINTTEEEIEGFHLIKSVLRKKISPDRISYRDAKSYFAILLDDNNRKPICRLFVESNNWYIGLFDDKKNVEKIKIENLDDIYKHETRLFDTIDNYEKFYK